MLLAGVKEILNTVNVQSEKHNLCVCAHGDNRHRQASRHRHGGKPHTSDTPPVCSDGRPAGEDVLRWKWATVCVNTSKWRHTEKHVDHVFIPQTVEQTCEQPKYIFNIYQLIRNWQIRNQLPSFNYQL